MKIETLVSNLSKFGVVKFTIVGNTIVASQDIMTRGDLSILSKNLIVNGNLILVGIEKNLILDKLKCDNITISSTSACAEVRIKEVVSNRCNLDEITLKDTIARGDSLFCTYRVSFQNTILIYNLIEISLTAFTHFEGTIIRDSVHVRLSNGFNSYTHKGKLTIKDTNRAVLEGEENISIHFDNVKDFTLFLDPDDLKLDLSNLRFTGAVKNLILRDVSKSFLEDLGVLEELKYENLIET